MNATTPSSHRPAPPVEPVSVFSLVLILLSALIHASWNLASRKTKGDLATLVSGVVLATLIITPIAFLVPVTGNIMDGLWICLASGLVHVIYIALVGAMYSVAGGSVSLVYPVARGTGVAFTAILARPILGEEVSAMGGLGVAMIICGIATMAWSKLGLLGNWANYDVLGKWRLRQKQAEKKDHNKDSTTQDEPTVEPTVVVHTGEIAPSLPSLPLKSKCHPKAPALALALLCGTVISSYSLLDKAGVGEMNPIQYSAGMLWVECACLVPYMLVRRRTQCCLALHERKKYIVIVGVGGWGCYLIVLYVLTLTPSSYVTALREVSVVFGAALGVMVLKEKLTIGIVLGVVAIVVGLVFIKMA